MNKEQKKIVKGIQLKKAISGLGVLTIIGISITLICGISYINSFFERFFPEDYLIWIGGLLLGLLFIITDSIYIQKYGKTTISESRLKVFGIIVYIVIFALVIDTFYFSFFISEYAILLTLIICAIFVIPAIIIGLSFFLLLLRTPYAKIVESKNIRIFYVIIAVLLIVLPITLTWGSISPTYQGRQIIHHLSLSSDGSRLLSMSGGLPCISPEGKGYGLHVWNTTSGELIWSECPFKSADISVDVSIFYDTYLSPRGEYFVKYPSMIYNSSTGKLVGELYGYYRAWSSDGETIATQVRDYPPDFGDIILYNTSDFISFKTVKVGKKISAIALSPNGTKLAFMPSTARKGRSYPISVIDLSDETTTNIWNTTNEYIGRLVWSTDLIKLVRFRPPRPYIIKVWNASTGEIINITDDQNAFNFSLNDIDEKFCVFDLSYDEKIMALGYFDGIIEIRNATTGMLIITLKTPLYEIERPIPFPSISYLLVGIVILALIIKRRKSKS